LAEVRQDHRSRIAGHGGCPAHDCRCDDLGSLHSLPDRDSFAEPWGFYPHGDAHDVVRGYLADLTTMVEQSDVFSVLAHIDYPIRFWPAEREGPFDPMAFEDEFRAALRVTAQSGRALEINTRLPLDGAILTWWHEEGGDAVTFGSDAHTAALVGHGFAEAAQMAEAHGFRPGKNPYDLGDAWTSGTRTGLGQTTSLRRIRSS
jgi:histidinol-phosphatase (PHP family)